MRIAIFTSLLFALSATAAQAQFYSDGDPSRLWSDPGDPYYSIQPSFASSEDAPADLSPASADDQNMWDDDSTQKWSEDCGCSGGFWGLGRCLTGCGCGCWTTSVAGLYLRRDTPDPTWLSFDTADVTSALLGTTDANTHWHNGVEARLRRSFGCDKALELVYWGRFEDTATASVTSADVAGSLNTPITISPVTFAGGDDVVDWYDDAASHTIRRDIEFHNVELNFIKDSLCDGSCGPLQAEWFCGLRFFKMDEGLLFTGVAGPGGGPGGSATPGGSAFMDVDTENNLVGFQVGVRGDYYLTDYFSLYLAPSVGIYGNRMDMRFQVYNDEGEEAFDIQSRRNGVSFLTQIDLGGAWQVTERWRAFAGYRVVAATGLALADDQFPAFLADTAGIADIDTSGSMVLHGGVFGLEFAF